MRDFFKSHVTILITQILHDLCDNFSCLYEKVKLKGNLKF